MEITMPQGARYIIEQLNNNGFEAYIVGGCVRDSILGKKPNDWDITTSAKPEQVKELFGRTVDTGIEHGTVTVIVDREHTGNAFSNADEEPYTFEVTTYRVDGKYTDHRRPESVEFTASLEEDLKRRDFTINAMAYNDEQGVVDIFGGIEDLNKGIVRCVGVASERFDEDALRILRAVRFAAQLGFVIEDNTKLAMKNQARFLKDISAERVREELTKLIISDNPHRLVEAYELGLTDIILPEFDEMMKTEQNNPYHIYNVGLHTINVMTNIAPTTVLRYTALLHDIGKPRTKTTDEAGIDHFYGHQQESAAMARQILRRLKFDNNTVDRVCLLVLNHDYGLKEVSEKAFRRFLGKLGRENYEDFRAIKRADMSSQSDYKIEERLEIFSRMDDIYKNTMDNKYCLSLKELAIDGAYLIKLGMKPGKEIGEMLKYLLEIVYDDPNMNKQEILEKLVKERMGK